MIFKLLAKKYKNNIGKNIDLNKNIKIALYASSKYISLSVSIFVIATLNCVVKLISNFFNASCFCKISFLLSRILLVFF